MPGIAVVVNPKSGRNRRDPGVVDRLARVLGDAGVVRAVPSPEALRRVAQEFRGLGLCAIGICGGDGTNSMTLGALLAAWDGAALPPIALLRGGSMNTAARALGVRRGAPDALLARLVRLCRARGAEALPQVERSLLRARTADPDAARGSDDSRVGFLFGAGVVCGFLADYYTGNGTAGPAAAARTLLRGVARAALGRGSEGPLGERFRGRVELAGGGVWPARAYLAVAAGTIDQIGLGFRPFPRCGEREDCFHLLGIHASPWRFARELPRIRRGAPLRPDCAEQAVAPRALLHPDESPLRYMIDGDLLEARGPLEVAVGPRVRIALP